MVAGIMNLEALVNKGSQRNRRARELALRALDAAIHKVDPSKILLSQLKIHGSMLYIRQRPFNLDRYERIYVVGGGKAGAAMAQALEKLIGDRISGGYVNVTQGTASRFRTEKIKLTEATHPRPSKSGVLGVRRMLELLSNISKKDLVIALISGGGSSILPYPAEGVSLEVKGELILDMMKRGANIEELNTVRKHLSKIKGGWLAKRAEPASVVSLILSDVVGDPIHVIASGPTSPDPSTFQDAINLLKKYSLWERTAVSVKNRLISGVDGMVPETPKIGDSCFKSVTNIVLATNRSVCEAVKNSLEQDRVRTFFLTSCMEGEARSVGLFLASLIQERISKSTAKLPIAFIAGGESTVTVRGKGRGGRNQELVLAGSFKIRGVDGSVIAAMGTDGIDGVTDAAGALVDGETISRLEALGMDPRKYLDDNDTYTLFSRLDDLIMTGPTGTNLNDISIVLLS